MKYIKEYIENIAFEYAITYSGFRGELFDSVKEENKAQIAKLQQEIETARFMPALKLKKQIDLLEQEINFYSARIANQEGSFHPSAQAIQKLVKGDEKLDLIFELFHIEATNLVAAACLPIFRDAIVFYSKDHQITGILHICFQCCVIRDENNNDLTVDIMTYEKLKELFIQLGHPIENNF